MKRKNNKIMSINETENTDKYICLDKDKMWYLADDTDTNIQDMIRETQYFYCKENEDNFHSISEKIMKYPELYRYWKLIFKQFIRARTKIEKMSMILNNIMMDKLNGLDNDTWYNSNDEVYLSHKQYLGFFEILDLAFEYYKYEDNLTKKIQKFNELVKKHQIYNEIEANLQLLIEFENHLMSQLEMSYYICEMLSLDFKPIGKKYKEYDGSNKLIRFRDWKDLLEDC